jgi:hypothetical protein
MNELLLYVNIILVIIWYILMFTLIGIVARFPTDKPVEDCIRLNKLGKKVFYWILFISFLIILIYNLC